VDSENDRAAQYFIAPRAKGGFVAFLVLAVTAAERQANEGNEKVDLFKKAALTAVTFKR
jgi:hypothetical protein